MSLGKMVCNVCVCVYVYCVCVLCVCVCVHMRVCVWGGVRGMNLGRTLVGLHTVTQITV